MFFSPDMVFRGGRVWTQHVIPRELQRIWTFPNFDRLTGSNASLAFGTSAHDNNGVVVLFFVRHLEFLGICCSMDLGNGEMDMRWVVFTLFLNFQLNYVSPSSYDLFQGSAYTGPVHRHRNR